MIDPMKVKATGPWAFVRILQLKDPMSFEAMKTEIYSEKGAGFQRIGYSRALVLSIGRGVEDGNQILAPDMKVGDVVGFRGYLQGAQKLPFDDAHCFVRMDSVEFEDLDLDMSLFEEVPEEVLDVVRIRRRDAFLRGLREV